MFNLKKEDWANSGRWVRDHFSNWFANSFVMVCVFAIIIASIFIGMYFDGTYAVRWSPDADAEVVFRSYGWLISLAMVFFTAAGVKAYQEGAKWAGAAFIVFGLYFTILSITQSIGVVTLKAQQQMATADAFEKVETVNGDRMVELRAIRDQKLNSKDAEIARIEGSIADIRNDGVAGISPADLQEIGRLNDSIATLRTSANADIEAIDALILSELASPQEDATPVVAPARFDAGIDFWAYVLTLGDPTDEFKEGLTYWYMLFWSIGCPIMGQMLAVYLVITRRTSENAERKDPKRVAAGLKGAKTKERKKRRGEKIAVTAESLLPSWNKALRYATNTKWSAEMIAKNAFKSGDMEYAITMLLKAGLITPEEVAIVKRETEAPEKDQNRVDVINPDNLPATTNGTGEPIEKESDDDSSIEPSGVSGN